MSAAPEPLDPSARAAEPAVTLRDYIAVRAMQALLSNDKFTNFFNASNVVGMIVTKSYEVADAMLDEREQPRR